MSAFPLLPSNPLNDRKLNNHICKFVSEMKIRPMKNLSHNLFFSFLCACFYFLVYKQVGARERRQVGRSPRPCPVGHGHSSVPSLFLHPLEFWAHAAHTWCLQVMGSGTWTTQSVMWDYSLHPLGRGTSLPFLSLFMIEHTHEGEREGGRRPSMASCHVKIPFLQYVSPLVVGMCIRPVCFRLTRPGIHLYCSCHVESDFSWAVSYQCVLESVFSHTLLMCLKYILGGQQGCGG